jgi:plasmid stabilization system protein ParE
LSEIQVRINALADQPVLGHAGAKPVTQHLIVRYHTATYRATYRVRGQQVIILRVRDTRQQGA